MEGFLNKKYPDIAGSKPVERAVEEMKHDSKRPEEEKHYPERKFLPHERDERIEAYLQRLDYIIHDERGWRRLKQKLVNEFAIDTNDEETVLKIAHSLYESEKRMAVERGLGAHIEELDEETVFRKYQNAVHEKHDVQERTLSAWLDYLHTNDAEYPTWFRYFVVRNLTKMGTLNKEKGEYSKRNDYTVAPFPELNSEALGFVYRMLTTGVGNKEFVYDPENDTPEEKETIETKRNTLTTLIEKKDFIKLYTFAQIETAGALNRESLQGEWRKFEQGSDHHVLEAQLQGKGTGWCTAEGSAYAHLNGGDFYVYFTKGSGGAFSEPRIAIRMEGDSVAEVRGVNHRQELEPALVETAQAQYKNLPGGEKFDKKSADMKRMTELVSKYERKEQFTKEDLRFLYEVDGTIEGFGYERDPRIETLRNERNRTEDIQVLCDCPKEYIATSQKNITLETQVYCEDAGTKLSFVDFREEKNKEKLPRIIEVSQKLKEIGSPAKLDVSVEGGVFSFDIDPQTIEALRTWTGAKQAFENADNKSPSWVWDRYDKDLTNQYEPLMETSLDCVVLSHGSTIPEERAQLIKDMDKAGYRMPTLAELIALAITNPAINKIPDKYFNTLKEYFLDGRLRAPVLRWVDGRRRLGALDVSSDWNASLRFVFVGK